MKKYLIIGNSTAAVGCIEGIRSADKEGEITVISKENRHTYCRPLISYYLEGKTDLERIKYRPDSFYEENGVRFYMTARRKKSTAQKRRLRLKTARLFPMTSFALPQALRPLFRRRTALKR